MSSLKIIIDPDNCTITRNEFGYLDLAVVHDQEIGEVMTFPDSMPDEYIKVAIEQINIYYNAGIADGEKIKQVKIKYELGLI